MSSRVLGSGSKKSFIRKLSHGFSVVFSLLDKDQGFLFTERMRLSVGSEQKSRRGWLHVYRAEEKIIMGQ